MITKALTCRIGLPRASTGHQVPGRNRYHLTVRGRVIVMASLCICVASTEAPTKSAAYRQLDGISSWIAVIRRISSTGHPRASIIVHKRNFA
jgi:hypothetical protein